MSALAKQRAWASVMLCSSAVLILLSWQLSLPWLGVAAVVGPLAPFTPPFWRDE
jgi:hypothetical protein